MAGGYEASSSGASRAWPWTVKPWHGVETVPAPSHSGQVKAVVMMAGLPLHDGQETVAPAEHPAALHGVLPLLCSVSGCPHLPHPDGAAVT